MTTDPLDQYNRETEVEIGGDKYLVRDNGAVYRRHRPGRRRSRFDETWTFGRRDKASGYMHIGSQFVHRIIAFAFLGRAPSEKHVVDHIDTNGSNNRAENLRWVTRLDNVLRHPSTRKKIIRADGSLDNFFADPRAATGLDQSIDWLRTGSKEEAERSRQQLEEWAESDGRLKGAAMVNRVYGVRQPSPPVSETIQDRQSLTPIALQRRWKTPTEFPSCPNTLGPHPLAEYVHNLRSGAVFSRDRYKETSVVAAGMGDALLSVLVRSRADDPVKPWAVTKVTFEDGKFVHEAIGTFFELDGANRAHFGLLGIALPGESIDDYS
jgi:hypothetical protein